MQDRLMRDQAFVGHDQRRYLHGYKESATSPAFVIGFVFRFEETRAFAAQMTWLKEYRLETRHQWYMRGNLKIIIAARKKTGKLGTTQVKKHRIKAHH